MTAPTGPLDPPSTPKRILYVDDDPAVLELTVRQLDLIGYQPVKARAAARAIELFQSPDQTFDAVITDLSMPGMNGVELARRLHELRPAVPIVLLSGSVDRIYSNDLAATGVRLVLQKPVPLSRLETEIAALFAER